MEMTTTQKRALSKKGNYNGFDEAFDNLPNKHRMTLRRELMKRLGWSRSSFYFKRRGESPLWENEVPIVKEVFERYHIEAFTGARI